MKPAFVAIVSVLLCTPIVARAQAPQPIPIDSARRDFAQAHALCSADNAKLWGVSLCGPIMFVDAPSRRIVASEGDAKGVLRASDGAFVGVLPVQARTVSSSPRSARRHTTALRSTQRRPIVTRSGSSYSRPIAGGSWTARCSRSSS